MYYKVNSSKKGKRMYLIYLKQSHNSYCASYRKNQTNPFPLNRFSHRCLRGFSALIQSYDFQ